MFVGPTSGSRPSTGMAVSAADQPGRIMDALWMDRNSAISTGAVFVLEHRTNNRDRPTPRLHRSPVGRGGRPEPVFRPML
jgi:hypothetical protein